MKVSDITKVLDLAFEANERSTLFIPVFVSEAGIGKSSVVQQWRDSMNDRFKDEGGFGFVDLRLAYYEGPDFVGMPYTFQDSDGITRSGHSLPDFWPTKGRGIIFFEEPNLGNSMIQNAMMQILTDRKVGPTYKIPKGWVIAAAMNPFTSKYDTNAMSAALLNRFQRFDVDFDFNVFLKYAKKNGWHKNIVNYLSSGMWTYMTPENLKEDAVYISPRTWERLSSAEHAGSSDNESKRGFHKIVAESTLGKDVGRAYWQSCWDESPVMADDILNDRKKAFEKLKKQCEPGKYTGDKLSITIESIAEKYDGWYKDRKKKDGSLWDQADGTIDEATLVDICDIIPGDQAVNLLQKTFVKALGGQGVTEFLRGFKERNPAAMKHIAAYVKASK